MKRNRKLGMVAGAVVLFGGILVAWAGRSSETEILYFSDDTFTVEVGGTFFLCGTASPRSWGEKTDFGVRLVSPCKIPGPPPEISCLVDGIWTTCPPNICEWYGFDC